jgi:glucokinase
VFYGHDGFAGELGHIIIDPKGRICECGRQGCLEMYVSAKGLKHTIDDYLSRYPNDKTLLNLQVNNFDGKKMDEAFDAGVNIIQEIYEFTGNILGQGLAQASTILSPEAFIFYGGLSNAKHRILKFAKQSMDANLLSFQKNNIKILLSELPDGEAGIIGASCLHQ